MKKYLLLLWLISAASCASADKIGYMIITTDEIKSHLTELNRFVELKERQGYDVSLRTDWGGGEGDAAAENLRTFLVKEHKASPSLEYVLLIGDPEPKNGDVPMKNFSSLGWYYKDDKAYHHYVEVPTNIYYEDLHTDFDKDKDGRFGEWTRKDEVLEIYTPDGSCKLLGTDDGVGDVDESRSFENMFDVCVGRIPCYKGEPNNYRYVDDMLRATVNYQSGLYDSEYLNRVLINMIPLDGVSERPERFKDPNYYFGEAVKKDVFDKYGFECTRIYDREAVDRGYVLPGTDNVYINDIFNRKNSVAQTVDVWNKGYAIHIWSTHGYTHGATAIIDTKNIGKLSKLHPCFIMAGSCSIGPPEVADNLAFSFLREQVAVSVIYAGTSIYGIPQKDFGGDDNYGSSLFYRFADGVCGGKTAGKAMASAFRYAPKSWHYWSNLATINLMGDPSIRLRKIKKQ
ncbi:MAG: hypothetical protein J6332_08680 [Abditibacteriota bacterium]|nr:hypothetical protein [Abditibacteriota bacterium]